MLKEYEEILSDQRFIDTLQMEIERLTEKFASFEGIKKFCVVPELFSQAGRELTPSLKIKRRVVEKKYADLIEKMYQEV